MEGIFTHSGERRIWIPKSERGHEGGMLATPLAAYGVVGVLFMFAHLPEIGGELLSSFYFVHYSPNQHMSSNHYLLFIEIRFHLT